ncbi:Uncharacterised protein [Citrobacter werkmanii]|uniref:Uncharacterized protein n=2 Tax=Citrobacter freundii complex TaxID=1344959 RepID=A0A9N8GT24_9ENTR|nr:MULTISPECIES: hypothetical protein [Citrobacter]MCL5517770.1 hypothetical protein [Citrobacter cronae]BBV30793.1 hypothetical protein STW0522CIT01_22820 [Citrobacter freundii]MBQ4924515.1 hypothetical protein [Citrobacter werkmanii]MBQ4937252.1 hypothetical protein [Citrobacter werkmanii]MBQ4949965.1 hypothetical protein [Citrobacter werkmanii]
MENAKDLAKEMLSALDLENEGMLVAYIKGLIHFPVDLYYLASDFIHTDERRENMDDNIRLAGLVKRATSTRDIYFVAKAVNVFIDDFMQHVNLPDIVTKVAKDTVASTLGSYTFGELTGLKIGALISSRITVSIAFSMSVSTLLMIGGGVSRAVHASRFLKISNYEVYRKLKDLGDLDLLYFAVQERVEPFEKATRLSKENPDLFNQAVEYFFKGL